MTFRLEITQVRKLSTSWSLMKLQDFGIHVYFTMRGSTLILGPSSFDRRNAEKIPFSFLLLSSFLFSFFLLLSFPSFSSFSFLSFLYSITRIDQMGKLPPTFLSSPLNMALSLLPFSLHFLNLLYLSFSYFLPLTLGSIRAIHTSASHGSCHVSLT